MKLALFSFCVVGNSGYGVKRSDGKFE